VKELRASKNFKSYDIFTVPESATMILNCGPSYPGLSEEKRAELNNFELELMKLQLCLENTLVNISEGGSNNVILVCDRGTMDLKPYMPEDSWSTVLKNLSLNEPDLYKRYDLVLYLRSVATGAESYYSSESNCVRTETVEEAKLLDQKTYDVWSSHSNFISVENEEDFNVKLRKTRDVLIAEANKYFGNH
jgi:hypothetical protein